MVASGLYHGVNPGMGWPLAVSAGLMGRGRPDLLAAMVPLALGHMLAMLAILLPFTLMLSLLDWQREIRIGARLPRHRLRRLSPAEPAPPARARANPADASLRSGPSRSRWPTAPR